MLKLEITAYFNVLLSFLCFLAVSTLDCGA